LEQWLPQWTNVANGYCRVINAYVPIIFPAMLAAPSYAWPLSCSIDKSSRNNESMTSFDNLQNPSP
jgi:hypothetical protein